MERTPGAGLVVVALLLGAASGPGALANEGDVDARVSIYTDDDETTVITPRTRAAWSPALGTQLGVGYAVDLITSASVDVRAVRVDGVSGATTRFSDQRHEILLSGSHEAGRRAFGAEASTSWENDFSSVGLGGSVRQELADRATWFEVGGSFMGARVGQAGTPLPVYSRALTAGGGRISVGRVLSAALELSATYELQHAAGYMASPYRFVDVVVQGQETPLARLDERVPERRNRHAAALRAAWAVTSSVAIHAAFRGYTDDWGMRALTADVPVRLSLPARLELTVRARGHLQSGADFYQPVYREARRYMTVDRKMAPMRNALAGLELGWASGPEFARPLFRPFVGCEGWFFEWSDHPRMRSRTALMCGADLAVRM